MDDRERKPSSRERAKALALAGALILVVGACQQNGDPGPRGDSHVGTGSGEAVDALWGRYPAVIDGAFGTSHTGAYLDITRGSLRDAPYADASRVGSVGWTFNFLGLSGPEDLAANTSLVVEGVVVGIGPPHFNSSDGSFWHPLLRGEDGIVPSETAIYRDVVFRVDRVIAAGDGGVKEGETISFAVLGGQVKVSLSADTAKQMELESGAGDYLFAVEAPVDLKEGEDAILFLDYEWIDGLYDGRYGERLQLSVAHPLYFKYTLDGGAAINATREDFSLQAAELEAIAGKNVIAPPPTEMIGSVQYTQPHGEE